MSVGINSFIINNVLIVRRDYIYIHIKTTPEEYWRRKRVLLDLNINIINIKYINTFLKTKNMEKNGRTDLLRFEML